MSIHIFFNKILRHHNSFNKAPPLFFPPANPEDNLSLPTISDCDSIKQCYFLTSLPNVTIFKCMSYIR